MRCYGIDEIKVCYGEDFGFADAPLKVLDVTVHFLQLNDFIDLSYRERNLI